MISNPPDDLSALAHSSATAGTKNELPITATALMKISTGITRWSCGIIHQKAGYSPSRFRQPRRGMNRRGHKSQPSRSIRRSTSSLGFPIAATATIIAVAVGGMTSTPNCINTASFRQAWTR